MNAHSGLVFNPLQHESLQIRHTHGAGQPLSAHRGHVSDISHPVATPGTHVISCHDNVQQPVNAHSGHAFYSLQLVSLQNEHTLGAGQPSSAHRGHSSDISRSVTSHSRQRFNPLQPVSMQICHSLNASQPVSTYRGHSTEFSQPLDSHGTQIIGMSQPVCAHSGHGLNLLQTVRMQHGHTFNATSESGQPVNAHRGQSSDISQP